MYFTIFYRFVEPPTDALLYLFNLVKLNLSNNLIAELTESAFDHVRNVEVVAKFSKPQKLKYKVFFCPLITGS